MLFSLNLASSFSSSLKPPPILLQTPFLRSLHLKNNLNLLRERKKRSWECRAELSHDAPFAAAIGGCILNSLVFPVTGDGPDDGDAHDGGSAMDTTDARFAVMGIISFIPYFNWLSWVFAWLDTGRQRYLVYAIVYLAPYLRTNLSLSPEESWLPIASIVFCIAHIQLEASIRNGDIQGFQLFNEALKFSPLSRKKGDHFDGHHGNKTKGRDREHQGLPSAQERLRNELHGWQVPEKPSQEHLNEDGDANERRKD